MRKVLLLLFALPVSLCLRAEVQDEIEVSSPEVPNPVAVRYCFRNWCRGNVLNNYGIPLAPFRSDDWDDLER